jgi:hypothetical protein
MSYANEIFGRINASGNVDILHAEDGGPVTRVDDCITVYPVGSGLSTAYEHADGIALTVHDAKRLGISIEV